MKLYFAAAEAKDYDLLKWCGVSRFLTSYFYARKKGIDKYSNDDLFLDSGAYSAYTQKKDINIDEYIDFIKKNDCEIYAGLDVIGDAIQTLKNIEYVTASGLNPIPTFHKPSKESDLLELLDMNFEYIALGGMAGIDKNVKTNEIWLDKVWSLIIQKNSKLKVHGFGMTTFKLMKKYPWYSVDSTTWNVARKFGEGFTPQGKRISAKDIMPYLKDKYGILMDQHSENDLLVINTVLSMLEIESDINSKDTDFSYLTAQQTLFS